MIVDFAFTVDYKQLKIIQLWLINSGQAEKKVPSVSYQSSLTYHGCAVNTIRFSPSGMH